jgi:toxin ParE1/3/4
MRLRLSGYVRSDLDTIWDTVARNGVTIADACLDRIQARFAQLLAFPRSGPLHPEIGENIRALVVERWVIVYRMTTSSVEIIRVIDGARDLSRLDLPRE